MHTPQQVVRQMEEECAAHSGVETGGILVGHRDPTDDTVWLVREAIGAGPNAIHRPASFRPDVAYMNRELLRLMKSDPQLSYLGGWHSHPGHMDRPSAVDAEQARSILADPDYRAPIVVVVIATTVPFRVRAYVMTREQPQLLEVSMVTDPVSSGSARQEAIRAELSRMSRAGLAVRQRSARGNLDILEIPSGDGQDILTAVFDRDFPRTRPQIMLQTLVPFPVGVTHLDEAVLLLQGQTAIIEAGRACSRVQALQRRGFSAHLLATSGGHMAFGLHRRGGQLAGFLTLQERTGAAALYDRHRAPVAVPPGLGVEEWARQAASRLSTDGWSRLRRLLVTVAVTCLILTLAWMATVFSPGAVPQVSTIPEVPSWIQR